MKKIALLARAILLSSMIAASPVVLAESAPVYDADSLPPQFDDTYRPTQQELPLPPAPGGEEQAFVPMPPPGGNVPVAPLAVDDQQLRSSERPRSRELGNVSSQRIESLQSEVQTLRGQVEQLSHQLQQLQQQQKSQYQDLDKRISERSLKSNDQPVTNAVKVKTSEEKSQNTGLAEEDIAVEKSTAESKPVRKSLTDKQKTKSNSGKATDVIASNDDATPPAGIDQPNVEEEQQIYQTAFNLIKSKKYNDAIHAMQGMLKKYPTGQFAANAHYWLGMLFDLTKKPDQALTEFSAVVKTYPNSPRVADAQLKVGLIYASQFKWTEAKIAFKKVISRNPGSSSARIAAEQLKQMKQAGH